MSKARLGTIVALAALLLLFVLQNTQIVAVRLLAWEFSMSRVVLILLAALIGFAVGLAVARRPRGRAR